MSKQRGLISVANLVVRPSNFLPLLWSSRDKPRFQVIKYLIFTIGQSVHYLVALCFFIFGAVLY